MKIDFNHYFKLLEIRYCAESIVDNRNEGVYIENTFKRLENLLTEVKQYENL